MAAEGYKGAGDKVYTKTHHFASKRFISFNSVVTFELSSLPLLMSAD